MSMKNICKFAIAFLLVFVLLLPMCACKRNDDPEPTEPTAANIALEQLKAYVIVYPAGDENAKALSNKLAKSILEHYDFSLSLAEDTAEPTDREILIGAVGALHAEPAINPPAEGEYQVAASDTKIHARGRNAMGDYYAVNALIDLLCSPSASEQYVSLPIALEGEIPVEGSLKAMSFNLMVGSVTPVRMMSVVQTIRNEMPDTIGVQEGSNTWMSCLEISLGESYAHVGEGRNGGDQGERSAIFYRKDRFDLMESGTKWLSDTPDTVSKFEDSAYYRIYTYVLLQEKKTGNKILVVNTHLDNSGSAVRGKQAAVLLKFLAAYENQYPVVLTGDFNTGQTSTVYASMTKKFADSAVVAKKAEDSFTFHKYGEKQSYLDYIFVSKQGIEVSFFRVITEEVGGMLPSDHYPLIAEYTIQS